MKYKRILLKLSGESLMGDKQFGIDNQRLSVYAEQIKEIHDLGVEVAIVKWTERMVITWECWLQ
jgi:uridylate kinase